MPILDMPLKELQKYKGINPCPKDFDAYWKIALAELDKQSLEYELEEVESIYKGVKLYNLTFTGVDNAKIYCKFLTPSIIDEKLPAIAMFHGYNCTCGEWFDKTVYAQNGFVVAAMDVRGQNGLSEDTLQSTGTTSQGHIIKGALDKDPQKLMYRNIFLDTAQLVRILQSMDIVDENRIGATGSSQGGALTLACAALAPQVKSIAFAYPFLCDFKRVWEMDLLKGGAFNELYDYFRFRDPRHEKEDELWARLGYIDLQNHAKNIKANCLLFTALMDQICPPSTQFAAYNKIKAKKDFIVYPDFSHEYLPDQNEITLQYFMKTL